MDSGTPTSESTADRTRDELDRGNGVDNHDTDERYVVESYGWSAVGVIGDGKRACIKSPRGATVCLVR